MRAIFLCLRAFAVIKFKRFESGCFPQGWHGCRYDNKGRDILVFSAMGVFWISRLGCFFGGTPKRMGVLSGFRTGATAICYLGPGPPFRNGPGAFWNRISNSNHGSPGGDFGSRIFSWCDRREWHWFFYHDNSAANLCAFYGPKIRSEKVVLADPLIHDHKSVLWILSILENAIGWGGTGFFWPIKIMKHLIIQPATSSRPVP